MKRVEKRVRIRRGGKVIAEYTEWERPTMDSDAKKRALLEKLADLINDGNNRCHTDSEWVARLISEAGFDLRVVHKSDIDLGDLEEERLAETRRCIEIVRTEAIKAAAETRPDIAERLLRLVTAIEAGEDR